VIHRQVPEKEVAHVCPGRRGAVAENARRQAVGRALELLYAVSLTDSVFSAYDGHLMLAFALIGTTSRDPVLSQRAVEMGRNRALHWVRQWPLIQRSLNVDTVLQQVIACDASQRLGVASKHIARDLRTLMNGYSTAGLLYFDAAVEQAPDDIPEDCGCGYPNVRGCQSCTGCRRALQTRSRYEVWYYALTSAYFCRRQAMPVQVRTEDIMRHLVHLRPYPEPGAPDHYQAIYAASHTVYVLNDYGRARLSPRLLPLEKDFLERNMSWALDQGEPDTVGEIIDSLLALGVPASDRLIVAGRSLLLDTQQADGGWGDEADDYGRFHTLWTAIDGLREHAWTVRGVKDNALRRALQASKPSA